MDQIPEESFMDSTRELSHSVPASHPSFPFADHPNRQNRTVLENPLHHNVPGFNIQANEYGVFRSLHANPSLSPSFYFSNVASPSSVISTPTGENPPYQLPLSTTLNPGSLSFEGLLAMYYPMQQPASPNSIASTGRNDPYDPSGLLSLQGINLSGNTPSPSASTPPSVNTEAPTDDIAQVASVSTSQQPLTRQEQQDKSSPAMQQQRASPSKTKCTNCGTSTTPLWRRDPDGRPLCNACGLFLKLHGVVRPLSLKTDVIKKRNRNSSASGSGAKAKSKHSSVSSAGQTATLERVSQTRERTRSVSDLPTTTPISINIAPNPSQSLSLSPTTPQPATTNSRRKRRISAYSSSQTSSSIKDTFAPSTSMSASAIPAPDPVTATAGVATFTSSSAANTTGLWQPQPALSSTYSHGLPPAVYAALETIGTHLNNLPPEVLPLIASAASYHAMAKKRQQQMPIFPAQNFMHPAYQPQQQHESSPSSSSTPPPPFSTVPLGTPHPYARQWLLHYSFYPSKKLLCWL